MFIILYTNIKAEIFDSYPNGVYNVFVRNTVMNGKIKQARVNTGLTQDELSQLIGMPVKTLRNWEQEIRKPNQWTVDLIIDRILREKNERMMKHNELKGILSFLTIKKKVNEIAKKYDINKIYLFGSYAKGEAKEHSDIDLYMEADLFGLNYFGFTEELRNAIGKKIDLLSDKTIIESSIIYEEIKKTGVLIYER
jgi:predicted nucleotidyltransferase